MRQIDWVELHCCQESLGIWSSTRSEAIWVLLSPASHLLVNVNYSAVFKFGVCSISLMSQTSHRVCGVSGSFWPQPHRRLNQGRRVCWKVACFPLSPLSSCLLAWSGGHWFLENGKKKKKCNTKDFYLWQSIFSCVCVYVCACVREHLHKHVFQKKRSVSIYVGNNCLEVRGELV